MAEFGGVEPLGLEEYDTPKLPMSEPPADDNLEPGAAAPNTEALTQMEENLGVEDLGVEDVLQTKTRKPLPKLDAPRLLNPHRGYPFLLDHLKKIKYRGKGDEKRYLKKYVNTYLIWANRLWPKANFDDFTVLARKAGRDPRVRQYCRDLIQEEKYGGLEAETVTARGASGEPNRQAGAAAMQSAPDPEDDPFSLDSPPEQPASNPRSREAASPPDASDIPEEAELFEQYTGPDQDEEAAALELYGDLDM